MFANLMPRGDSLALCLQDARYGGRSPSCCVRKQRYSVLHDYSRSNGAHSAKMTSVSTKSSRLRSSNDRIDLLKRFKRAQDGRSAMLALKRQAEGRSATDTRKQRACSQIATARCAGPRRNWRLQKCIERHRGAQNELPSWVKLYLKRRRQLTS